MSSLNKVQLIGVLGRDPETRRMQSGDAVVNMSLATSERWTDKQSGERKEKTTWHNIVVFNDAIAKVCEQYLRKGSKIYVDGSLQTREWQDKDGQKRYSTEIVLQKYRGELVILDSKRGNDDAGDDAPAKTRVGEGSRVAMDDEIPFAMEWR